MDAEIAKLGEAIKELKQEDILKEVEKLLKREETYG